MPEEAADLGLQYAMAVQSHCSRNHFQLFAEGRWYQVGLAVMAVHKFHSNSGKRYADCPTCSKMSSLPRQKNSSRRWTAKLAVADLGFVSELESHRHRTAAAGSSVVESADQTVRRPSVLDQ